MRRARCCRAGQVIFPPNSKHEQPLIVTKSDGGFSYDSTDMAAVWYRLFELKAERIVYVTDAGQAIPRQRHHHHRHRRRRRRHQNNNNRRRTST